MQKNIYPILINLSEELGDKEYLTGKITFADFGLF